MVINLMLTLLILLLCKMNATGDEPGVESTWTQGSGWKARVHLSSLDSAQLRAARGSDNVCVSLKETVCAEKNRRDFSEVLSSAFGSNEGYQAVVAAFFGGRRTVFDPFPNHPFSRQSFRALQTLSSPDQLPDGFPNTLWLFGPYKSVARGTNCPGLSDSNKWDVCLVYLGIMGGQAEPLAHITLSHSLSKTEIRREIAGFIHTLSVAADVVSSPAIPVYSPQSVDGLLLENKKLKSELNEMKTRLRSVWSELSESKEQSLRDTSLLRDVNEVPRPMSSSERLRQRLFLLAISTLIFGGGLYIISLYGPKTAIALEVYGRSSMDSEKSYRGGSRRSSPYNIPVSPQTQHRLNERRRSSGDRSDRGRRYSAESETSRRSSGGSVAGSDSGTSRNRNHGRTSPCSPPGGVIRFLRRYSAD